MKNRTNKTSMRGGAIIEAALLVPWIFFLFVGVLDFGFYSTALISVQNAARVAALSNAYSSDAAKDGSSACVAVLAEVQSLPNARLVGCPASAPVDNSHPLSVTAALVQGPDNADAASVTVTYLSIPMIPIPGILTGQLAITRTAIVPVLNKAPLS